MWSVTMIRKCIVIVFCPHENAFYTVSLKTAKNPIHSENAHGSCHKINTGNRCNAVYVRKVSNWNKHQKSKDSISQIYSHTAFLFEERTFEKSIECIHAYMRASNA